MVGFSPSKHLAGDAGGASGSRELTGDAEEVHVVGFQIPSNGQVMQEEVQKNPSSQQPQLKQMVRDP